MTAHRTANTLITAGRGWTVYQTQADGPWSGCVRIDKQHRAARHDFPTRTQAVDWCLDLAAMRDTTIDDTPGR